VFHVSIDLAVVVYRSFNDLVYANWRHFMGSYRHLAQSRLLARYLGRHWWV
jgi:hypothetical protein